MCIYIYIRMYIYVCIYIMPHMWCQCMYRIISYYDVLYTRAKGIRLLWPLSMFIFQFWISSRLGHEISGPVGPWASQPRDQNVAGMTSWTFASADPANCSVEPDLEKKKVFLNRVDIKSNKKICVTVWTNRILGHLRNTKGKLSGTSSMVWFSFRNFPTWDHQICAKT